MCMMKNVNAIPASVTATMMFEVRLSLDVVFRERNQKDKAPNKTLMAQDTMKVVIRPMIAVFHVRIELKASTRPMALLMRSPKRTTGMKSSKFCMVDYCVTGRVYLEKVDEEQTIIQAAVYKPPSGLCSHLRQARSLKRCLTGRMICGA